ncbi:MAG: RNB domain-containing ribonuclease [Betaproteobacteria bacterium]|nr:RNB domain-containing ribonuclease [Betaproteobacteria bacterium]
MYVLFEEDGAFRAGAVLSETPAALQVELPAGRRVKIKAASVLLHFGSPGAQDLLDRAEAGAEELDVEFLWEASGDAEFGFEEFAAEYYGQAPAAVEAAALLLRLHSAPIYFHRKGRGRFRKAPPEILKAALAGLEKKRAQALAIERMGAELLASRLPGEIAAVLQQLLYHPDRNRVETKALELACAESGLGAVQLLARCGAIPSAHAFHFGRFLFEHFPAGTAFGEYAPPVFSEELPRADVQAFSIDDATTTEIDDAFSVTPLAGGGWRVGIHIAAPGLGFAPGSDLDAIARARLSTVYMPGRKITMLPDEVVERFTLAAGADRPALSLYLDVTPDLVVKGSQSRLERVPVVANLRHHDIEPAFNADTIAELAGGGGPRFEFRDELLLLWRLAEVLEAGRGKPAANQAQLDYSFYVDWDDEHQEDGGIRIVPRKRGSPLDKLVAELMIVANATWGAMLAKSGVAAIYRVQGNGKVRLTTAALAHEGLGVEAYAWCSSPLRRYVDLVNQWQLLAAIRERAPAFTARSEALLGAMRDFELAYAAYADFQRLMERYWCLRWLQQEQRMEPPGAVLRENLVRVDGLPLVVRVPSLPELAPGRRVRLQVESIDLLGPEARLRFAGVLDQDAAGDVEPAPLEE